MRKAVVQKAVGKVLAVSLVVSMVIPPQLGYAFSIKYAGEGRINSVNNVLSVISRPTLENLLNFSAFLPVPCPPDIPILTLPNGDATRDGKINESVLLTVKDTKHCTDMT